MSGEKPYLSLIIPAYNEVKRIASTVVTVRSYLDSLGKPYEIIVVDDGSTDGTGDVLASISGVRAISYQPNRGKGYAVREGIVASGGDMVAFSDVDLSAPIDELSKLFGAIDSGADVAIGSRALRKSELVVHQPLYRELGGKSLNFFIRVFAVPGIHDTQCGFKLFKGELARKIFSRCILDGWGFDVEALYLARRVGARIAEIPVRWSHCSDSRINPFTAGLQVLRDVLRIRLHRYSL